MMWAGDFRSFSAFRHSCQRQEWRWPQRKGTRDGVWFQLPSGYDSHSHGFSMAHIEIDGLPFLKMVMFHGCVTNNQMVYSWYGIVEESSHHPIPECSTFQGCFECTGRLWGMVINPLIGTLDTHTRIYIYINNYTCINISTYTYAYNYFYIYIWYVYIYIYRAHCKDSHYGLIMGWTTITIVWCLGGASPDGSRLLRPWRARLRAPRFRRRAEQRPSPGNHGVFGVGASPNGRKIQVIQWHMISIYFI